MRRRLWIEYDKDGLPLRVTDTAEQMAEEAKTTMTNVISSASYARRKADSERRFHNVEVEDEQ